MKKTPAHSQLQKTLPRHCYLQEEFFAKELRHIFRPEWFCVARAPEFEAVGDYQVIDLCGESVIVLRSAENVYQAFYNLCRHRGSQLVPNPACARLSGHFKGGIRCPYHSWLYALNGELRRTPHVDIERSAFGLHTVPLEIWGGYIFLKLDTTAGSPGLLDGLGDIAERVRRYPLAQLRVGHRVHYSVAANWKVILENYNECYHCAGVHPELCAVVPAFRKNGGAGLDWERGVPHKVGANTFTFSGTTTRKAFPGLDQDEQTRHKGELIYPNLLISLAMDHVASFTLWPRAADRTDIICEFLFHPDEMRQADFDASDAVDFWDLTNRQDWAICESVQRGMRSSPFEYGYYAPMEDLSLDIRDYVRSRIPGTDA